MTDRTEYAWDHAGPACIHEWVVPALLRMSGGWPKPASILDIGCGNGYLAAALTEAGWQVTGIDMSQSGIDQAKRAHPEIDFLVGSAEEDLKERYGPEVFDIVISVDVIEHLYRPRCLVENAFSLLKPEGLVVLVTPYHGYLKNLLLALSGQMDKHFTALWEGGHIKFWSRTTLTGLLVGAGFKDVSFRGVGRLPCLWKSMILTGRKPGRRTREAMP